MTTFAIATVCLSFVQFRWRRVRPRIEGTPVVVVLHGEPQISALGMERLTLADVRDAARQQGIADLAQVRFGVLETDGKFSFVREDGAEQPPNTGDLIQ